MKKELTLNTVLLKPSIESLKDSYRVSQLPNNGVLIFNQNGSTTFVPNVKIIEAPNGILYLDSTANHTTKFE